MVIHRKRLALAASLAIAAAPALAFWAPNHMSMTQQVAVEGKPFRFKRAGVDIRTLDDYLKNVLLIQDGEAHTVKAVGFRRGTSSGDDGDKPSDAPSDERTLLDWNQQGAFYEDGFMDMSEGTEWGGYRAVNHFHNPLAPTGAEGYNGFMPWLPSAASKVPYLNMLRSGISAAEWAKGGGGNLWGLPAETASIDLFFTGDKLDDRKKGIGNAMRAMGQIEHLAEDNAVPDHARDLPHPGNGFEEFMQVSQPNMFHDLPPATWTVLPVTRVEALGLRALWDQDAYTGDASSVNDPSKTPGISEFANANFFAWNLLQNPLGLAITIPFSTVPNDVNVGFSAGSLNLPYPRLAGDHATYRSEWKSDSHSLLVNHIAYGPTNASPPWNFIVDATDWQDYAQPLLAMAHGYAQSVLTLLLPPINAEIVPDSTDPMGSVHVRIVHEGGQQQSGLQDVGDGVTWHVKKIVLKPTQPKQPPTDPFFAGTAAAIPLSDTPDIGPAGNGAPWESGSLGLTYDQRNDLMLSSHVAVEISAQIGSGSPQPAVPVTFGVMIPAGFVSIEQTVTQDTSTPSSYNFPECPVDCSTQWSQGTAEEALMQTATGKIHLYYPQVDVFGDATDGEVASATNATVRLAGIALMAADVIPETGKLTFSFAGGQSSLTLTGSNLTCTATFCVRDAQATSDDQSDPAVEFDASQGLPFKVVVDLLAVANQMTLPNITAAANNIYLVAWTTAGTQWVQKLALWLPGLPIAAMTLTSGITCPGTLPVLQLTRGTGANCGWNDTGPNTCDGNHSGYSYSSIQIVNGYFGAGSADLQEGVYFGRYPRWVPMKLAGQDVNANPSTAMPRNCPEDLLSAGAPCQYGYGIIYGTESTDNGSGPCGSPTAPSQLEKSAEYDLDLAFVGNASAGLTNTLLGGQYGYKSLPKTVTVKLH